MRCFVFTNLCEYYFILYFDSIKYFIKKKFELKIHLKNAFVKDISKHKKKHKLLIRDKENYIN